MKYQTIKTIVSNFRAHLKTKDVKPSYCKKYGTKYPGSLSQSNFMLYAMLLGKSPESCTHDINDEGYLTNLNFINNMINSETNKEKKYAFEINLYRPFIGKGVTEEDIKNIIKNVA